MINSENKMKRHKMSRFISFCNNKVLCIIISIKHPYYMETMEFQVDSCVLVIVTYEKKLGLHFGKELLNEREFINFVDHYAVAVKNNSSDGVP